MPHTLLRRAGLACLVGVFACACRSGARPVAPAGSIAAAAAVQQGPDAGHDPEAWIAWLEACDAQDPPGSSVSEEEIGRAVARALERWPEAWQMHEFRAAHCLRIGDPACAREAHAAAAELYAGDPFYEDPVIGLRTRFAMNAVGSFAAGPVGGVASSGLLALADAIVPDHVVPFPPDPALHAWRPAPTAWRNRLPVSATARTPVPAGVDPAAAVPAPGSGG